MFLLATNDDILLLLVNLPGVLRKVGEIFLVSDFYARMSFHLDTAIFDAGKDQLSEDCEYLLYVGPVLGRGLQKRDALFLCETKSLLECHFSASITGKVLHLLVAFIAHEDEIQASSPIRLRFFQPFGDVSKAVPVRSVVAHNRPYSIAIVASCDSFEAFLTCL